MNSADIIRTVSPFTMTNPVRMQALYEATTEVSDLEGDVVETGCREGGSSMLMAMVLKLMNVKDKKIYMYDTFDGMPEPGKMDNKVNYSSKGIDKWYKTDRGLTWNNAPIDLVRKNITKAHYPIDNFILTKGLVEETIPKVAPEKICLLRLDTDFYSSTKHALEHLFPRVVKGGYLIIDDYGCWDGCKQAVDEYFKEQGIKKSELNRVDKSCREFIK